MTRSPARLPTGTSTRWSWSPTARCWRASCRQSPLRRLDRDPLLLPRGDLRLLRGAHQRRTGLACHTHLDAARAAAPGRRDRDRADGQHARDQGPDRRHGCGALEEDPARHAVAARQAARPRARVRGGQRAMVDVTQTMACIQCGACVSDCLAMEVDPGFIGPAALAKAYRFVGDPRDDAQHERLRGPLRRPAGDLRLHALLQVRGGLPQGRQPDGPDHAPAPHRGLRPADRRRQQRPPPRGGDDHA